MDTVNLWLKAAIIEDDAKYGFTLRKPLVCSDGFTMSIQASKSHYCSPREHGADHYSMVELWSTRTDGRMTRSEPEGWVPVHVIERRIKRHGGLSRASLDVICEYDVKQKERAE